MKQRVVLIGQSPLSYFLARELDRQFGDLVHCQLRWLSGEPAIIHLPTITNLLDRGAHALPAATFKSLVWQSAQIRSINLKDQRIVTSKGVVEYDRLLIDNRPAYTPSELTLVRESLTTLLSGMQSQSARSRAKSARIYCQGATPEAWQLALLIQAAVRRHYPRLLGGLKIIIDNPGTALGSFLRDSGLTPATATTLKLPGLTIKAPQAAVNNRLVRGWRLTHDGAVQQTAASHPIGQPNVTVLEGPWLDDVSLLRVLQTLARAVVRRLGRELEGEEPPPLTLPSAALGLSAAAGQYVAIGSLRNRTLQARVVRALEQQFRLRLGA